MKQHNQQREPSSFILQVQRDPTIGAESHANSSICLQLWLPSKERLMDHLEVVGGREDDSDWGYTMHMHLEGDCYQTEWTATGRWEPELGGEKGNRGRERDGGPTES